MNPNESISVTEAKDFLKANNQRLVVSGMSAFVALRNIQKIYPNGFQAVYDFNLDIEKHEFISLVGPSGCGKSTTLRMIAGLEDISSGELYINQTYSNYLPSKDRDIAMVFQSYALYPQMSVFDNIAFGLKIRHMDSESIQERVFEAARIMDLGNYLDRKPKQLSGGQMQRVALGRAIVRQANLFLMDEPLSNLDAKLRVQMRNEIVRIHKAVGATTIYVTHDQIEAMTMSDRMVVMNQGFVQQSGRPMDIYHHPANLFVATFIGSPSMNIFEGSYFKGTLTLTEDYSLSLGEDFHQRYLAFNQARIDEIQKMIDNPSLLTKDLLKSMDSHKILVRKDEITTSQKASKKGWLKKISSLFHRKDKQFKVSSPEIESNPQTLEALLFHYQSALTGPTQIQVGIRPEHFYDANHFSGEKKSRPFHVTTELMELMGSEQLVHFQLFGKDAEAKLSGVSMEASEEGLRLVFDETQIHLFDQESGLAIR